MSLQDIYQYFQHPHPVFLSKEVTVCYVLYILVEEGNSYRAALLEHIKSAYPPFQVSDTILNDVFKFLTDEGIIHQYRQDEPSKGRPKKMFSIRPEKRDEARGLAQLWHQFLGDKYGDEHEWVTADLYLSNS